MWVLSTNICLYHLEGSLFITLKKQHVHLYMRHVLYTFSISLTFYPISLLTPTLINAACLRLNHTDVMTSYRAAVARLWSVHDWCAYNYLTSWSICMSSGVFLIRMVLKSSTQSTIYMYTRYAAVHSKQVGITLADLGQMETSNCDCSSCSRDSRRCDSYIKRA